MNNLTIERLYAFIFSFFITLSLSAQLPSGFTDAKMQSGYTAPMGIAFSKNGQYMLVWEKAGLLWVSAWNGSTYIKQATPTLDLREEVADWRDLGLESVALDPDFDANGLIYLFYQVDRHHLLYFGTPQYNANVNEYFNASISRLTRYQLTNVNGQLVANTTTRKVLLGETKSTGVPLTYESHAGGQILFGTDGTLLVSTGDGASFASNDFGSASETYYLQALADGIIRTTENCGAFRAQLINSFCGKLLRLDPNTGDAIPSNPYYDAANPRSAKSRVWALGFRNPYRMSFKNGTGSTNPADSNPGTLLVGDVQNGTWEEFHMVEKGGINCGWPLYEGLTPQYQFYDSGQTNLEEAGNPTFKSLCEQGGVFSVQEPVPSQRRYRHFPPALDWRHGQTIARYPDFQTGGSTIGTIQLGASNSTVPGVSFSGNCVTSGTYYNKTNFPPQYQNVYFFGDYEENWIKAAVLHDNDSHQLHEVKEFAPTGYCKGLVDIEMNPLDGSIFYVNINTGDIQRISYGTTNRPPVAVINADRTSGISPLFVNFNSDGSNDPDGNPITYVWDFGDGTGATSATTAHTFTSSGTGAFTVKLTVTDNQGLSNTKTIAVSTNNTPPSVKITNPTNNGTYSITGNSQLTLQSNVIDNDVSGLQYAWQVTLRHNTHEHREPILTQPSPTVQISPVGCDGNTYYYLIELTVTDNGGLSARDSVKIYPDCPTSLQLGCLTAAYFNNRTLAGTPAVIRGETSINNDYVYGGPNVPNIGVDNFSVRWEGSVVAPVNGTYTFTTTGDDGMRLWVNNVLVIDKWFDQSATTYNASVYLTQGQIAPIKLEYYEGDGRAQAKLFWTIPSKGSQIVAFNACVGMTVTQKLGCLTASYFNNTTLAGTPVVVRGEEKINNDYARGGPSVQGIGIDFFSIRWEGIVIPPTSGTYTFTTTADDGVRLWVNGVLLIDKWFDQSANTYSANINLAQDQNISIKLEYYEGDGRAQAKLFWTIPNQVSQIIPFIACSGTVTTQQLGCLKASYFNNTTLSGTPVAVRAESSINNEYLYAAPSVQGIGVDNFSVRWEGTVIPSTTGTYTFTTTSDDGVRLWVNNVLIIDKWFDQSATNYSATVNLTKDQNAQIKMEYYEGDGRASAKLFWTIPNQTSQIIAFNACPLTGTTGAFDPTKCYTMTGRQSLKVIEVPNSALTNGTLIEQRTLVAGAKNQIWKIKDNGEGSYRLVNGNSGKVITVNDAATVPQTYVSQSDWTTADNQRFVLQKNTEGYYKLLAKHSNLPLEVQYSFVEDGVKIWQSTVSGTYAQEFKIDEVGCPSGVVPLSSANILTANGYKNIKKAVITWVSNANESTDYFMVQKLNANQPVFEKLTTVYVEQSTTNDKKYYTVEDNNPNEGENLYRVALFRKGGVLPQYSEVISLDFSFLTDYMLFPNPSDYYVDIDLESVRYRSVDIKMLDVSGKIVRQLKVDSAPVGAVRIDLEGLPVGAYFVRIEAEGKRTVVKKMVIAR